MSKLVLSNQEEITIEGGSSLSNVIVASETKNDMISIWDMFTEENIKCIQIQNDDGIEIGNYDNLVLESETSKVQENGSILTNFHFRVKTEVELLRERVVALETGQEIQDGAIMDLGEAVSTLSE